MDVFGVAGALWNASMKLLRAVDGILPSDLAARGSQKLLHIPNSSADYEAEVWASQICWVA